MRVALFATCLVDGLFPDVGRATVRLLRRLGHEVDFPRAQSCCGQMHLNTGYPGEALPLVRHHVASVSRATTRSWRRAARAPAAIRHQHADTARRFGDGAGRAAEAVAARTYELSEFLVDVLGVTDVGAYFPHRVTYHPTCHSLRLLRVGDRPLPCCGRCRASSWLELPAAESCCGFGGTFAMKNARCRRRCWPTRCAAVVATGAGGLLGRRLVLPDAHRRRPVPAARRRADPAPGRDPGQHPSEPALT